MLGHDVDLVANSMGRAVWWKLSVQNQWISNTEAAGAAQYLCWTTCSCGNGDSHAHRGRCQASTERSLKAVGSAQGSPFTSFSWEIRAVSPADSLGRTIPPDRENHQQSVPGLTFWLQPETFSAASPLSKYKAEPKTIAVLPRDRNSTLGCSGAPVLQDTWSSGKHANWHCYRCRDSNPRTSWSPETRKRLDTCPEHSCLPLRSGLERRKSRSPGWEAAIGSFQAFLCRLLRTTKGEGLPDAARALPESAFKNASFINYFLEEKNYNLYWTNTAWTQD